MKIKISNIVSIALVCFSVSCTDGFDAINTNPNASTTMSSDALMNQSITATRGLFGGRMNREIMVNYAHYINPGGGEFQKYGYVQTINGDNWQTFYVNCLQPTNNILEQYGNNPAYKNRVNIAKIFQAYIYSEGVAIWGGLPKSQALKGTNSVPYETEDSLYTHLISDLKTSVKALDVKGDKYQLAAEPIYSSDITKWKKFGNSLLLRLYVRLSDCATGKLSDSIKLHATYLLNNPTELIASNAEQAATRFGIYSKTWNDFYDVLVYGKINLIAENTPVMHESFIMHTKPYSDPRLGVFADTCVTGPFHGNYWGKPKAGATRPWFSPANGVASIHANRVASDYSSLGAEFLRPDAEWMFLSYPEVCFLKAELALKTWGGKGDADAQAAYEAGIEASMVKLNANATSAAAYKMRAGILWGTQTALDTIGKQKEFFDWMGISTSMVEGAIPYDVKMKQIVMQEWIALFPNGLDAWTLHRRTQLLELPPHFGPAATALSYTSGYTYIPQRLLYPTNEYQTNGAEVLTAVSNLGGLDNLDIKLWFAKPQKKNFYGYKTGLPTR